MPSRNLEYGQAAKGRRDRAAVFVSVLYIDRFVFQYVNTCCTTYVVMIHFAQLGVILIGELFSQFFDIFFALFFNLPYFPVFFSKYWNVNELDIFAF